MNAIHTHDTASKMVVTHLHCMVAQMLQTIAVDIPS